MQYPGGNEIDDYGNTQQNTRDQAVPGIHVLLFYEPEQHNHGQDD
jgi:hypothetical protein